MGNPFRVARGPRCALASRAGWLTSAIHPGGASDSDASLSFTRRRVGLSRLATAQRTLPFLHHFSAENWDVMLTHAPARFSTYHTHKQRVLGNPSAQPAPAWRPNAKAAASGSRADPGSKILISRLPLDVEENEVEVRPSPDRLTLHQKWLTCSVLWLSLLQILFSKTVGPVKEVFMVYNSQGRSKGMAVVSFARAGDAAVARAKYNGKIVDGRRPIKIEIVVDEDDARPAQPAKSTAPSLLERLSAPTPAQAAAQSNARKPIAHEANGAPQPVTNPRKRLRAKKGPRRLNKQQQARQPPPKKKTAEELDREMEEYRAREEQANIKSSVSMEGA
ncbi:hypothetical protein BN946_scf184473.g32 [Trametes cinnabarina]|uniref:RRM domain-containing protein n=1 Tax=Pycnoporus cinnabarinus TaxID=5643 RepID=A0A060SX35_PYCCI|nr:hypothetical protein BN946_scf184473.g32 [Trametes cinnabarina]